MIVPVEIQLMREMAPRSRPSRGYLDSENPTETKLYPGTDAFGMETMVAKLEGFVRSLPLWANLQASFTIDGMRFSDPRPGILWLAVADIPTCIIHFPIMAGDMNPKFSGLHTLMIRTVLE